MPRLISVIVCFIACSWAQANDVQTLNSTFVAEQFEILEPPSQGCKWSNDDLKKIEVSVEVETTIRHCRDRGVNIEKARIKGSDLSSFEYELTTLDVFLNPDTFLGCRSEVMERIQRGKVIFKGKDLLAFSAREQSADFSRLAVIIKKPKHFKLSVKVKKPSDLQASDCQDQISIEDIMSAGE